MELTSQEQTWQGPPPRKYVFSAISPQNVYAPLMVSYMKKKLGPGKHTVAIYYANVPYGQFGDNLLTAALKKLGWTIDLTDNWDPTKFDFSAQAAQIASKKPQGVFLWGAATPADAQVLKQLRAAGYSGPAVGEVAFSLPDIPADAGSAATTVVAFGQLNTIHPNAATKAFLTNYQAQYKSPATFLPGAAYDAVHVFAAAAKKAGCTTNPDALVSAMNGLTYQGVTGTFHYTPNYKSGPGFKSFFAITYNKAGQTVLATPQP
jgi:branched-chain amino acid transport system substrate-binding protein